MSLENESQSQTVFGPSTRAPDPNWAVVPSNVTLFYMPSRNVGVYHLLGSCRYYSDGCSNTRRAVAEPSDRSKP